MSDAAKDLSMQAEALIQEALGLIAKLETIRVFCC
jgi:hypothetical protein